MRSVIRFILEWLIAILIALVIFSFITMFFAPGKVSGESMMPTYHDKERVYVIKKGYQLEKGDVITFWADKQEPTEVSSLAKLYLNQPDLENKELHIKRIIGVPGDEVEIKKEPDYERNIIVTNVYINGEKEVSSTLIRIEEASYTLEEGEYFVVGDNYNNSLDSRIHGPVKEEDIFGKIINGKERTTTNDGTDGSVSTENNSGTEDTTSSGDNTNTEDSSSNENTEN